MPGLGLGLAAFRSSASGSSSDLPVSGATMWYKASRMSGAFGASVPIIPDLTNSGTTAIQADPARQATFQSVNGQKVLRFASSTYAIATTNISSPIYTQYWLMRESNLAGQTRVFHGLNGSGIFAQFNGLYQLYSGDVGMLDLVAGDTTNFHICTCMFNGDANTKFYFDGVLIRTGNAGGNFPTAAQFGSHPNQSEFQNMDFIEAIQYPGSHSGAQRALIEAYLATQIP